MIPKVSITNMLFITVMFIVIFYVLTSSTIRVVPYSNTSNYSTYREGMTLSPLPLVPEKSNEQFYSVPNFQGVYSAPGVSVMIDKIGSLNAGKFEECKNESNLSTSNGFLCLTNEAKELLSSRGGNA